MPISMKTMASQKRKADLEERSRGLESAIEKYSDPATVFIECEGVVQEDPEGEA
jgi:hypothetical protein